MEASALNEWLSLMLDEIRRKQREREEAARERERREPGARDQGEPGTARRRPAGPDGRR
jgi:hypothetical protein